MFKILYRYITKAVLVNFFIALIIFTVFFFTGDIIRIVDLVLKGIPLTKIASFFMCLLPYLLSICLPTALLTAIILVFGQLSQDNEITAMRASGVSIRQISIPVVIVAFFLSMYSIYLNDYLLPQSHFQARKILYSIGFNQPAALLEPGEPIKTFPDHIIYIKEKKGNKIKHINIQQKQKNNQVRIINARKGEIIVDKDNNKIILKLIDGHINEPSGDKMNKIFNLKFGSYTVVIDTGDIFVSPSKISKKHKEMSIGELLKQIRQYKEDKRRTSQYSVEIHKKLSISFSCISFALIGIALGVTTHRSEKTIGAGMSLIVLLVFYMFILLGKALDEKPQFFPELFIWLPHIIIGGAGIILIRNIEKR